MNFFIFLFNQALSKTLKSLILLSAYLMLPHSVHSFTHNKLLINSSYSSTDHFPWIGILLYLSLFSFLHMYIISLLY
jgi:hypothetical protein